jgi:hypothetical protein
MYHSLWDLFLYRSVCKAAALTAMHTASAQQDIDALNHTPMPNRFSFFGSSVNDVRIMSCGNDLVYLI